MRKFLPRPKAANSTSLAAFMAHFIAYYFWGPVVAAVAYGLIASHHKPTWLAVIVAGLVVAFWLYFDWLRELFTAKSKRQQLDPADRSLAKSVNHDWNYAMSSSGFASGIDKNRDPIVPRLLGMESVGRGLAVDIEFLKGVQTGQMFIARKGRLASAFNVVDVDVIITGPRTIRLVLITRNPLQGDIAPDVEGVTFGG